MAVTQMAFKGIVVRFLSITILPPLSGGAIRFLYPRIDVGYEPRPLSHPMRQIPQPSNFYLWCIRNGFYNEVEDFGLSEEEKRRFSLRNAMKVLPQIKGKLKNE